MENEYYPTLTLILIVMFAFLPTSFAQNDETINLEAGHMLNTSEYVVRLVYFLPDDRETESIRRSTPR